MSDNNTITITLPVTRDGDKFKVPGWFFRTRDQWAEIVATWGESADLEIARAMVEYIDALPENRPGGYGFLGTLDVGGEGYDVSRESDGEYAAISRADGEYLKFQSGFKWTHDWSDVLAAGKFTPRSDA